MNSCPAVSTVVKKGPSSCFLLHNGCTLKTGLDISPCLGHSDCWGQKGMPRRSPPCGHAGGTLSPARGQAGAPVLSLQFWEPERTADGGGPYSALQLRPPSPTSSVGSSPAPPSCRIGGESALQSEMGAASGDSSGCGGRMDLGSPAAAPGERKCCGVAWSLPVVLYPCLSSLSGTPSSR